MIASVGDLTPSEIRDTLLRLERDVMEESLYEFILGAWPILEPSTAFVSNWHIECMAEHLQAASEGYVRKIIFNVPPGSMKSLCVSVCWPAWHWIRYPQDRFLTASHSMDLSGRDARKSRILIQSAWFRERWGDRFKLAGDQNAKTRYENDHMGYRIATHVGGATGERAKIRVLDDPHNIDDAESDLVREGAVEWVRSTWSERESDSTTSMDVVVMQRVHHRDTCGYLLELGGFEHVMIPMEFEPKRKFVSNVRAPWMKWKEDPRTEKNELLFPARWDRAEVEVKKTRLGSYRAAGQLQQRPSPEEGGIVLKQWWRYWHYPGEPMPPVKMELANGQYVDIPCEPLPNGWDSELQSWDCSFKDTQGSDFVVGQHWAKHNVNVYLMRQTRGQLDFPKTQRAVEAMAKEFVIGGPVIVEDKANGPAVIASLRHKVPGLIGVNPEGGKEARAHAYSWVVEAGHCYLPHPTIAPWVDGFIEEVRTFPNGDHDDQVDAWSQAMHKLYGVSKMGVSITPEYSARFFVSESDLHPVPGLEAFRFWYFPDSKDGVAYPAVIVGQVLPAGQIRILDCLQIENESIDALIDKKLTPVLNSSYRGVWKWRDVSNIPEGKPGTNPSSLHQVVNEKLKGSVEPGEPSFDIRVNAIKTILGQTNRLVINKRVSQGERELLVHEALNGGYSFEASKDGHTTALKPQKGNKYTAIGEALGHGLARIFVRRPDRTQSPKERKVQHEREQGRARGYGVRS